jgi:hypothetical protein
MERTKTKAPGQELYFEWDGLGLLRVHAGKAFYGNRGMHNRISQRRPQNGQMVGA